MLKHHFVCHVYVLGPKQEKNKKDLAAFFLLLLYWARFGPCFFLVLAVVGLVF